MGFGLFISILVFVFGSLKKKENEKE